MPKKDKRIDAYIAKAKPFAQPILKHLRELVHKASPEIQETVKWGAPFFEYKGTVCGMAAFKKHTAFVFPKAALMKDAKKLLGDRAVLGHLGRITKLTDLPSDKKLISYLKEAIKLNEEGKKVSRPVTKKKPVEVPDYFMKILNKNKKALAAFAAFSPSHKREYIEWITEAKTEPTREKRIATAIEWMSEGKSRNWKYKNC